MRHVFVDIPYAWAIHPHPTTRIRPVFPGHGRVRRKRTPVPYPGGPRARRRVPPTGTFSARRGGRATGREAGRRRTGCGPGGRGRGAGPEGADRRAGGRGAGGRGAGGRDDLAGPLAASGPRIKQTHRWPQDGHGRPLGQRCDLAGPAASGLARIRTDPCDTAAKGVARHKTMNLAR